MKIIKRGQLAMLSIAFMIMIAGYINYKYDPEREQQLGQTVKVDGSQVYLYTNNGVNVYDETEDVLGNKNESMYKNKSDESSLETFRMSRDNMLSELEETYKELSESITAVNSNDVNIYKEKLDNVIKTKHLINIVEGILKAKGITDIVIVPTDDNYNVMVELEDPLTNAQVAMIQQIIEEEFKIDSKNIKIIQK